MSEIDDLHREYRQNLRLRLQALESLEASCLKGDPGARGEMRSAAHKIAGSAGTYGLAELSAAAKALEDASAAEYETRLVLFLQVLRVNARSEPSARGKNILVIEDDPDIHRFLKAKLSSTLAQVWVASTGQSAMNAAENNALDLIFLDLNLPDVDGRVLIRKLRSLPNALRAPIYVVSAIRSPEVRAECLSAGAAGYVQKPFNPEQILEIVNASRGTAEPPVSNDPETGLPDKAGLARRFMALRDVPEPFSVAFLLVKNLESIADSYGKDMKAQLLKHIAARSSEFLKKDDAFGRLAENAFVALLPSSGAADARARLETLAKDVSGTRFEVEGKAPFHVRLLLGACAVDKTMSFEDAIMEAESQLLLAADRLPDPVAGTDPASAGPSTPAAASAPRRAIRILLADDDEMIVSFVRHRLSREGFEILAAADGTQALEIARAQSADLVILDIQMPGMNGIEVLAQLRKLPGYAKTPVMMLSSLGGERDISRAFESGANDYLVKPFSPVEMQARIRRLIQ